jgi:hypothetical protein
MLLAPWRIFDQISLNFFLWNAGVFRGNGAEGGEVGAGLSGLQGVALLGLINQSRRKQDGQG